MKRFPLAAIFTLPLLGGCLTAVTPENSSWPVEFRPLKTNCEVEPRFGPVRILNVSVRAPYSEKYLTVLRAGGTVAFDPANEYAASPAALVKALAQDAFVYSGLFSAVVGSASVVHTDLSAEVAVTRLALDCRGGERRAVAAVTVRLVKDGKIVAFTKGEGGALATDGDYGMAFSEAVSSAFTEALGKIR